MVTAVFRCCCWGLASLGGGRGAQRVWSAGDKSSLKHLCSRVQTLPDLACFIWWLLLCSALRMEIIIKNTGKKWVFMAPGPPGCRGSYRARSVEGQRQLSVGTREGLLGSWKEANLSKQCGQNEAERRRAGGENVPRRRECLAQGLTFLKNLHILQKQAASKRLLGVLWGTTAETQSSLSKRRGLCIQVREIVRDASVSGTA